MRKAPLTTIGIPLTVTASVEAFLCDLIARGRRLGERDRNRRIAIMDCQTGLWILVTAELCRRSSDVAERSSELGLQRSLLRAVSRRLLKRMPVRPHVSEQEPVRSLTS